MLGAIFDKWWSQSESNQRHKDFQSFALPTELQRQDVNILFCSAKNVNSIQLIFQKK